MDRLEEIRQRTEAATDGPWERFDTPDYAEIHVLGGKEAGFLPVALAGEAYNADFIAHSREDIPYLLSEVDRLNTIHAEYTSNSAETTINGRQYVPKDTIATLTARAEAAEARADAAIVDLRKCAPCWLCKKKCGIFDALDQRKDGCCPNFEWRGQQAGKGDSNG